MGGWRGAHGRERALQTPPASPMWDQFPDAGDARRDRDVFRCAIRFAIAQFCDPYTTHPLHRGRLLRDHQGLGAAWSSAYVVDSYQAGPVAAEHNDEGT